MRFSRFSKWQKWVIGIAAGFIAIVVVAVLTSPSSTPTADTSMAPSQSAPAAAPATHPVTPVPSHTAAAPAPASAKCSVHWSRATPPQPLPDPHCTPGAVLTRSTADVCSSGWAENHREEFSKAERIAAYARYGISTADPEAYGEYDHLIPLELGGSNDPANLWPEKGSIPNEKDAVEDALHNAVCSGHISLATAQHAISTNWTTAADLFPVQENAPTSAPPPPVATTHAPPPAPHTSAPAPVGCYPTTSGGNCYRPGEFCPSADHGTSGVAGDGKPITCEESGGAWRWV